MVLLLRHDGKAAAGFALSSPGHFLDFAGLTVCCRNAAIR
jgi:hypothetical protein